MEDQVRFMISESARRLGLDASDADVLKALEVGVEAVRSGYSLEQAFEFGRGVLVKATQPIDVFAA